jgi:cytochrome P450
VHLEIDPTSPKFFVAPDYIDVLAQLRSEAPVFQFAPGLWTVACYDQIRDLSRDPKHFCSGRGALVNDPLRAAVNPMSTPSILHLDPPAHTDIRGLVNRRFTPRAMSTLESSIRAMARQVIEKVPTDAPIDFVATMSAPFPLMVIAELLGIPGGARGDFRRWSDAAIESPDLPASETMAALGELSGFIVSHIKAKQEDPGDDLVSLLVESDVAGRPLEHDELFMFLLTLLIAGNETTRTLLSGSALALFEHQDQRDALLGDSTLLAGAVEECLRWVTPVQAFCRTATEDVEVAGQQVSEGDYLIMLYASGNRDESVFGATADQFDVSRTTNPMHLAFGFGEHVCLGASLARLETRIFLEEFLARFPAYQVTGPAVRVPSTTVAGIRQLPMVLAPST